MAGQIRLTPEELRSYAAKYGQESSNTGELIGRLDGMINQLAQVWEGAHQAGPLRINMNGFAHPFSRCSSCWKT